MYKSIFIKGSNSSGFRVAQTPKIRKMLKMLLPMIFPSNKPDWCRDAAITVVISSGRDVPIAIMNKEINAWEKPIAVAKNKEAS